MLVIGSKLSGTPVLSFHLGGKTAELGEALIDPEDLSVRAYRVYGPIIDNDPEVGDILDTRDIREYSPHGVVVDSADRFVMEEDVIRIQEIIELGFGLIGHKVISQSGSKIGKVVDYTVDTRSWSIYQIIVQRPFLKSFIDPELTINRSQITEIDDYKITIKNENEEVDIPEPEDDAAEEALEEAKEFVPNYENPFRKKKLSQSEEKKLGVKIPREAPELDTDQDSSKEKSSDDSSSTMSE